jgi:hypothetical protein
MDIDVEVTSGGTYSLGVTNAVADQDIVTGPAYLRAVSLRDVLSDVPVQSSGNVVAPAAGATIAVTAALVGGTYTVNWNVGLQGAAAAADANNFQLVDANGVVLGSINPGAAGDYPQDQAEVTIANGTTISVKAIGAGTAAVTYSAQIDATPTGEVETIVEIQDGSKPILEITFKSERAVTVPLGRPGVCIETVLHLHVVSGAVSGAFHVSYDRP